MSDKDWRVVEIVRISTGEERYEAEDALDMAVAMRAQYPGRSFAVVHESYPGIREST